MKMKKFRFLTSVTFTGSGPRWKCIECDHFSACSYNSECACTSVCVIEEDESVPVIVVQQWQQSSSDGRPQLQRELAFPLCGEAGSHQADVQGSTKRCQRVHWALVVKAEDGKDPPWILRTNWCDTDREKTQKGKELEKTEYGAQGDIFLIKVIK